MQKTITLLLARLGRSAPVPDAMATMSRATSNASGWRAKRARLIKYIDTTLRYRRKHNPGPEVEEEWRRANAERRAIHSESAATSAASDGPGLAKPKDAIRARFA